MRFLLSLFGLLSCSAFCVYAMARKRHNQAARQPPARKQRAHTHPLEDLRRASSGHELLTTANIMSMRLPMLAALRAGSGPHEPITGTTTVLYLHQSACPPYLDTLDLNLTARFHRPLATRSSMRAGFLRRPLQVVRQFLAGSLFSVRTAGGQAQPWAASCAGWCAAFSKSPGEKKIELVLEHGPWLSCPKSELGPR